MTPSPTRRPPLDKITQKECEEMTKLTEAQRDSAVTLLEQHQNVTTALAQVSKPGWFSSINLTKDEANDYTDVSLDLMVAKAALKAQKESIVSRLAKLGIDLT